MNARLKPLAQRLSALACLFVAAALSGCVTPSYTLDPQVKAELLDGSRLFGHAVEPAPVEDVLALSDEMRDFLTPRMSRAAAPYSRFRRLMSELVERQYFANTYEAWGTFSAAETFANKRGNCLGYTNMFIALARALNLNAQYQLVESHPEWDVAGGYLIRNNHINVILPGVRPPNYGQADTVVDFNLVQPDPDSAVARTVSDEFAAALFHANLAVDLMHAGQHEQAFAQLKRGAMLAPRNKIVWNNLGVLYSKNNRPAAAQQAYQQALLLDNNDKSAWVGMAVALTAQGKVEEAAEYNRKVERYQQRNPFYHYAIAAEAVQTQDYDLALRSIESAIDLRRRDPRFYMLQAKVAELVGDDDLYQEARRRVRRSLGRR